MGISVCPYKDLEDRLQNLLFNDRCEVLLGWSSGFVSVLVQGICERVRLCSCESKMKADEVLVLVIYEGGNSQIGLKCGGLSVAFECFVYHGVEFRLNFFNV